LIAIWYTGQSRRNQAAVCPPTFLGEPFDGVGGRHRLDPGLGQDLALLQCHDGRDLFSALADQLGGLAHHLGALKGRGHAPGLESFFRSRQCLVEICPFGVRNRSYHLFARRVEDRDGFSRSGGTPLAVDIQLHVLIGHSAVSGFLPRGGQHVHRPHFKG
jgi:hypothetical protein